MNCSKCNRIKHVTPSKSKINNPKTNSGVTFSIDHSIKSMDELAIPPSESPDLVTIRSESFSDTLVSISDAHVARQICKPVEAQESECPDCDNSPVAPTCENPKAQFSKDTDGKDISDWLDAKPVKRMTLFGRVGKFLSKLKGEGVLWLDQDGQVSVKKYIPSKNTRLWHRWYKPTSTSAPVIGNPMNYPYKDITDFDGNSYSVMGLPNEDSFELWNAETGEYEQRPISELLDIVFQCSGGVSSESIAVFRRVEIEPTYDCDPHQTTRYKTVVEFIPNPDDDCDNVFTYNNNDGHAWKRISDVSTCGHDDISPCCCQQTSYCAPIDSQTNCCAPTDSQTSYIGNS